MSLFESIETNPGVQDAGSIAPSVRRAAMLEHPTLAVAAIQKGRIRETNGPWRALFALPSDVSVESHVATLFPNATSADRFERALRALRAELATPGGAGPMARSEHMLMRRDGSVFLAELVVWLFDADDAEHPLGGDAIWQVRDITVERTLRRELRDLEDYHRELSRHQWDMTFVIDRKGRIAYASSSIEGALGYRVNAMLGTPFASFLDPAHAPAAEQWLRAASRQGPREPDDTRASSFPLRVQHSDGSTRVLACSTRDCFAIPRIAGMVVHARDVTEEVHEASVDLDGAEAASLRAALIEFARSPSPSPQARIATLLEAICGRIDAFAVTFWEADAVAGAWTAQAAAGADAKDATPVAQKDFPPPLLSGGPVSKGDGPLVVDDVLDPSVLGAYERAALLASGIAAVVEVPVVDDGRTLGWLAVAASHRRQWTDAELDFILGSALLVALAVKGRAEPVSAAAVEESPTVRRDPLTGLVDRTEAERVLGSKLEAAAQGEPLVAIVVDLDRLQEVNDSLGLAAGDAVIARAAAVLVDIAGHDGFVARIGGDEFLVVVQGADSREIDAMAQSMLDRIGTPGDDATGHVPIQASIGVARHTFDGSDASALLLQADLAMREAKNRGRAQAFVFNAKLAAGLRARKDLESEIEQALRRNEFMLFYQPQIALATGKVVSLEALLRWQHPTKGLLLPDAFIGAAIQLGLIESITKFVLAQVCEQIAAWRRAGDLPELPVAVNISGRQFHDRRLPALVASALLKSGLPARLLVLEITEQSRVGDDSGVERVVKELSRLGVRIAIGDFNMGHASFKYLRQLQVSQIKLEGSFVKGLPNDAESAIVVAAFVELAHRLTYQVIAEGVETREQFEYLREIGCGVGQGFYLGAPLSAVEIHSYLEANRRNPIR